MMIRRAATLALGCVAGLALTMPVVAQAATSAPAANLVRYYNGAKHWSTTGEAPGGRYKAEGAVTILAKPAPGTVPLYSCMAGHAKLDQFLSLHRRCEGDANSFLRLEGHLYAQPTAGFTRPIYRCHWVAANSHFFSLKSDCEATATTRVTAEHRLGYVRG
ncbi:hypothetical protein [Nonomuraea sp. B5E05]|uniref:hypothetical protein n=1 Tax=Nonomuraea sp. B5E05 TaxID=3153569 RepID=UPI003260E3ED